MKTSASHKFQFLNILLFIWHYSSDLLDKDYLDLINPESFVYSQYFINVNYDFPQQLFDEPSICFFPILQLKTLSAPHRRIKCLPSVVLCWEDFSIISFILIIFLVRLLSQIPLTNFLIPIKLKKLLFMIRIHDSAHSLSGILPDLFRFKRCFAVTSEELEYL